MQTRVTGLLKTEYPIIQGGMAVSYTHLDVYKRQILIGRGLILTGWEWM